MDTARPTIPDVVDRFRAYLAQHPAWGSLHIVLEDGNTQDSSVDGCLHRALEDGDVEGAELARVLRRMSRTQRLKLGAAARAATT
jgi:hypothetical protein